jgi:hypothetical protein
MYGLPSIYANPRLSFEEADRLGDFASVSSADGVSAVQDPRVFGTPHAPPSGPTFDDYDALGVGIDSAPVPPRSSAEAAFARSAAAGALDTAMLPVTIPAKLYRAAGGRGKTLDTVADLSADEALQDATWLATGEDAADYKRRVAHERESFPSASVAGTAFGSALGGLGLEGLVERGVVGGAKALTSPATIRKEAKEAAAAAKAKGDEYWKQASEKRRAVYEAPAEAKPALRVEAKALAAKEAKEAERAFRIQEGAAGKLQGAATRSERTAVPIDLDAAHKLEARHRVLNAENLKGTGSVSENFPSAVEFWRKNPEVASQFENAAKYFETNPEDLEVINRLTYSSSGLNADMRRAAQQGRTISELTRERAADTKAALESALANGIRYEGPVYRTMQLDKNTIDEWLNKGFVQNASFLSSSANREYVTVPKRKASNVNTTVTLNIKTRSGVPIAGVSKFPHEHEVVIPPGRTWRVTGHSYDDMGHVTIDIEEMARIPKNVPRALTLDGTGAVAGQVRAGAREDAQDKREQYVNGYRFIK